MCTEKVKAVMGPRRTWSAHGAILVASVLGCQQGVAAGNSKSTNARNPAGQQAPQTQEKPHTTSTPQKDLTSTSIEDLMNMEVTSASKKEQKLSQVAAAIFVITQEDIRRSGATNIPDVLRIAPGVQVAQLDANIWVITIRGFSDRFADKVLVLIDGRTVYTPTTSGVYWDQQDVPLDDIERIEVIRGPGGTIWGANAVNGVINITTKSAKDTRGGLVSLSGGSGNPHKVFAVGGTGRAGGRLSSVWKIRGNRQSATCGWNTWWRRLAFVAHRFPVRSGSFRERFADHSRRFPANERGRNPECRTRQRLAAAADVQQQDGSLCGKHSGTLEPEGVGRLDDRIAGLLRRLRPA